MTTALAVPSGPVHALGRALTQDVISQAFSLSTAMYKARIYGVDSPEQALAIMLEGWQLGFNLTASFAYINIIKGETALTGAGVLALIHRSNLAEVKILDELDSHGNPFAATVWMQRRDTAFQHTIRFTLKDAQRALLIKGDGAWEKWPANMLRWRALTICARLVVPDLLAGLYVDNELRIIDQEPEIQVVGGRLAIEPVSDEVFNDQPAATSGT